MVGRIQYLFAGRGVWVDLDPDRLAWCWQVARELRADAKAKNATDKHALRLARQGRKPTSEESLSIQAFGVMGEFAVAQVLGFADWEPKIGVFLTEADIGANIDARTASFKDYGLRVRSYEKADHISVFVLLHQVPDLRPTPNDVYRAGRALVVGWCRVGEVLGRSAWKKDFNTGGEAEVTVPQEHLRPMRELCTLLGRPMVGVEIQRISFTQHMEEEAEAERAPRKRWQPRRWTPEDRAQHERERKLKIAQADAEKRAWIEAGNEERQPPEYRGQVFEHADHDGVHPTAFPPLRESAGGELSDEFIDFQRHNYTTVEKNPEYYCVRCRIRYNAGGGGMCGPCLGETASETAQPAGSTSRSRKSTDVVQYPL